MELERMTIPTFTPGMDIQSLTIENIAHTSVAGLREQTHRWLREFIIDHEVALRDEVEGLVARAMTECTDEGLATTLAGYRTMGEEFRLLPSDPVARHVGRAYLRAVPISRELHGAHRLRTALESGPCLLVSNHMSYADSQFVDLVLYLEDAADLADRVVSVAGPKVYQDPFRRMAAMSLNTLPTVQSTSLGRGVLSPREVARIALGTVRQAGELMNVGYAVMLYAEGTRSRSGRLGSFFRATSRYARTPGCQIIPSALTGPDKGFPIHQHQVWPTPITLSFGDPIPVGEDGATAALERAWHQLAELLPDDYRPLPGTPALR